MGDTKPSITLPRPIELVRGTFRLYGFRAAAWVTVALGWLALWYQANKVTPILHLSREQATAIWIAVSLLLTFNVLIEILSGIYSWAKAVQRRRQIAWISEKTPPSYPPNRLRDFFGFEVAHVSPPTHAGKMNKLAAYSCIFVELPSESGDDRPDWLPKLQEACADGRVLVWRDPPPSSNGVSERELLLYTAAAAIMYAADQ